MRLQPPRPAADADVEAVLDCLRSGWLTMGPRIAAFEAAFAERLGAGHAVAAASAPAALHLALAAVGAGPDDEVIVPALDGGRAAAAAQRLGARAVPADVAAPDLPHLDPAAVEAALTDRVRAVVVVHPAGHPAETLRLAELCDRAGVALVEEAALGVADAGRAADVAAFALSGSAPVDVGEGAMVVARDEAVAARVRLLRSHAMTSGTWDRHRGHAASYDIVDIGYNARLDEARAALGAARLERLGEEVGRRRETAAAYRAALAGSGGVACCFGDEALAAAAPQAFLVAVADAGAVARALAADGIETLRLDALADGPPRARAAAGSLLGLPVVGLGAEDAERVASRLLAAAR